jgi:MFS family permease
VSVFVSYSRAQFYFAEDLALALGQHGIDAWFDVHRLKPADDWEGEIVAALRASDGVVFVASGDALASPHVRAELDLAQELGKPVVAALAEHVELPGELAAAPRIDLWTGFEDKVRSLSDGLKSGNHDAPNGATQTPWRARADVVHMVSAVLLATALVFGAFVPVLLSVSFPGGFGSPAIYALPVALISAFCGWLWWAFSHRAPGSVVVLAGAFVVSVPAGAIFGIASGALLYFHLSWLQTLLAAGMLAVVVAWLVAAIWALRSASFYRWIPTGEAPRWIRRRMLARRGHRAGASSQPAGSPATYDIWCHDLDSSARRALDSALQAHGHRRAEGASADRQILVLSNLTPTEGLTQRLAQLGDRGIVVISAAVELLGLEHAERYQWVDYRRRDRRTLDRLAASIAGGPTSVGTELIPESIGKRVMPIGVLAVAVVCIVAAALNLATGIAGLFGVDIAEIYGASQSRWRALAILALGAAALWLATALVTRRLALRHFLAGFVAMFVATLAAPKLASAEMPLWTIVPTAVVGIVVLALSSKSLAAWLPPRSARSNGRTIAAHAPAWWRRRTTYGVAAYTAALTVLWFTLLLPFRGTTVLAPCSVIGAGYNACSPAGWRKEPRPELGEEIVLTRGDPQSLQELSVTAVDGIDALPGCVQRGVPLDALDATQQASKLDGTDATMFSYRLTPPQGQAVRCRKLAVSRNGLKYEVTLTEPEGSYPDADKDYEEFLRSWHWLGSF